MLSMNRIKLMTALALYEDREGRKEIKISNYKRNDYVGLHMLTTAILATVGYLLILGIVSIILFPVIAKSINGGKFMIYATLFIVGYIVFLVMWLIYAYKHFGRRHREAKEHAKNYFIGIRRLNQLLKIERKQQQEREKLSYLKSQLGGKN